MALEILVLVLLIFLISILHPLLVELGLIVIMLMFDLLDPLPPI